MQDINNIQISPKSNKKNIILLVAAGAVIIAIVLAGYFWWNSGTNQNIEENAEADKKTIEGSEGTLPSFSNNPLDSKPNLNPVDNTNPIKAVKTNPFE